MKKERFTRKVEFQKGFDSRGEDPDYGIGALCVRLVLKKGKRAVHFYFSTGIYLPSVTEHSGAMEFDLGYHSPEPIFKGQNPYENCPYIHQDCYHDGSSLRSDDFLAILVREGEKGIWDALEKYWHEVFEDATGSD
jgi:hypothetical protein